MHELEVDGRDGLSIKSGNAMLKAGAADGSGATRCQVRGEQGGARLWARGWVLE